MRVLLIHPPQKHYMTSFDFGVYVPLGLLSLAACVRDLCEVHIYDALVRDFTVQREGHASVFGAPIDVVESFAIAYRPDVIGINIPFTSQSELPIKLGRQLKKRIPGAVLVFGGPDVAVRYGELLRETPCDYCVVGEGEVTFRRLIECLRERRPVPDIPGLAVMAHGVPILHAPEWNRRLDDLPLPAYDLADMNAYFKHPNLYCNRGVMTGPSISVITSRGCPFDCIFCSIHSHMGRAYRSHSPEYVIRHLKHLIERYGVRQFHFEDDNISLDTRRFERLLDAIIQERLDMAWDLPNGIRGDSLNERVLRKMKEAGCRDVRIAVESADQRVLNTVIGKKTDLESVIDAIVTARRIGLPVSAFYVIGFPGETVEDMRKTVNLALSLDRRHGVRPIMLVATPLPGTPLYAMCREHRYMPDVVSAYDLANGTSLVGRHLIHTPDFSEQDIDRLARYYIMRYAINRPGRLLRKAWRKIRPVRWEQTKVSVS